MMDFLLLRGLKLFRAIRFNDQVFQIPHYRRCMRHSLVGAEATIIVNSAPPTLRDTSLIPDVIKLINNYLTVDVLFGFTGSFCAFNS